MTSKEVLEAFKKETPVRYGDIVFDKITSVKYSRIRASWRIDRNENEDSSGIKTFVKIISAICVDVAGNEYQLNPLRLIPAQLYEVTGNIDRSGKILEDRMRLADIYSTEKKKKCSKAQNEFIFWLFENDIINVKKAYDLVRAFEVSNADKP